jgi:hypothetical protein
MPSQSTIATPITPPRVPLIDPKSGQINRSWYLFFLSLFDSSTTVFDNPDVGPSPEALVAATAAELQTLAQIVGTQQSPMDLLSQIAELQKQIQALQLEPRKEINGATGLFTTVDSKTVKVVNGIITSIV